MAPGGSSDEGLVLGDAHPTIDVERFGTHPAADELDHPVLHASGVECRSESRSKRMERVKFGDRFPVKMGERGSEKSVKKMVGVRLARSVGK
jgi:hypothetical protein